MGTNEGQKGRKDQCLVLKMTRFVVEICGSAIVQNEHSSPILNKRSLTNANAMIGRRCPPSCPCPRPSVSSSFFMLSLCISEMNGTNLLAA
ncbi:hypothetical protein X798_03031 [Onchocerca flexuosa]|uniref:Uncharacterized protein n=1 Tax=Onchocerca flexuosa TaxID=387005 RepID=A0A238BYN5_9BILA|nr:hypothetical protein X798_03031 [Onchocerca flexuosa]